MKYLVCFLIFGLCAMWASAQNKVAFSVELEAWNTEAGLDDDDGLEVGSYGDRELMPIIGLAAQYNAFFIKATQSLDTEWSGTASLISVNNDTDDFGNTLRTTLASQFETELERQDTDISIGYSWPSGFSLFGGFKQIDFTESFGLERLTATFDVIDSTGTLVSSDQLPITGTWVADREVEYDGPFIGVAYGYALSNAPITIMGSAAYADLDGEYGFIQRADLVFQGQALDPLTSTLDADLEASGLSWKIGATYSVSQSFSVGLSFRSQTYDVDPVTLPGGVLQLPDLESNGAQLTLRYVF